MHAIRRAEERDIAAVAKLLRAVRHATLPSLPELHTPEEDLRFFRNTVFTQCEIFVAEATQIDGFIAFRVRFIDHLYVRPEHQRAGLGTALLKQATDSYDALRLWVFQRNTGAIAFYRAHDFREVERSDGSRNEERQPDVLMEWARG